MVTFYNCYDYSEALYLIEMGFDFPASKIRWMQITIPEEGLRPSDWQVPYLEQYLNEDGTERICDLYDEPEEDEPTSRVAFFIYKVNGNVLKTPYGEFDLIHGKSVPDRLQQIIEFENDEDEDDEDDFEDD